jgi:hypothetical protein
LFRNKNISCIEIREQFFAFENLEISNGTSGKLSVGWPEEEELKTVSNWTGEAASFSING